MRCRSPHLYVHFLASSVFPFLIKQLIWFLAELNRNRNECLFFQKVLVLLLNLGESRLQIHRNPSSLWRAASTISWSKHYWCSSPVPSKNPSFYELDIYQYLPSHWLDFSFFLVNALLHGSFSFSHHLVVLDLLASRYFLDTWTSQLYHLERGNSASRCHSRFYLVYGRFLFRAFLFGYHLCLFEFEYPFLAHHDTP